MSYDFMLLRLRRPAARLNDLAKEHVVHADDYEAWRDVLRARFPRIEWRESADTMRGQDPDVSARFEIALRRSDDFTHLFVHGSFHADQRAAVQALAAALDATAFDIQTGLALPPA